VEVDRTQLPGQVRRATRQPRTERRHVDPRRCPGAAYAWAVKRGDIGWLEHIGGLGGGWLEHTRPREGGL
jgi:hypothetical protein